MSTDTPHLGAFEELLLLTVESLGAGATAADVGQRLAAAGRAATVGALYTTLGRLEEKGFITTHIGPKRAVRGGRARRHVVVTVAGAHALADAERVRATLRRNR